MVGDPYISFDVSFSLPFFYVWQKNEETLSTRRSNFYCKIHHQILSYVALCLSVQLFQMPLEGLSFVKMLITFGIIYITDLLL